MDSVPGQRQSIHLPLAIEEITAGWLTAALRIRAPAVTVERCEIVDILRGTCTKIRFRLHLDAAGQRAGIPETVILKGGFEAHSREMCGTHEKEVRAYRDIIPVLGLRAPACYFAEYDSERRQGIVIIEDLVARGVTFCDPLKPQSYDEVARRLTALAAFHARSWDSPRLREGGEWCWVHPLLPATVAYMKPHLQADRWEQFTAAPRGAAVSVRFHDREWVAASLERLVTLSAGLPVCVIHGDTHLGNLYIDRDGTPGFFDPQMLSAPSLTEVAYHVTCALDTADRARWEEALVRHYLEELRKNGVAPMALDDAMRLYGAYLVYGYTIFLVNESFFQPEAVNTAYAARFSAAMLENGTAGILRA